MMLINRRMFVAGAAAATLLPVVPALAQDDEIDGMELLHQIPGLKSAWGRRYTPADGIHEQHSPIEPNEQTPDYLLVMALVFESRATLFGVMNTMLNASIASMIIGRPAESLTEATNPKLADGNILYFNEDPAENHPYVSMLAMQVDNVAYIISTRGESAQVQVTVNALAEHLMEAEVSDEPVTVVAEGVAEGGVFEAMPGLDDLELLNGLVPMFDYDLLESESPILPAGATPEP